MWINHSGKSILRIPRAASVSICMAAFGCNFAKDPSENIIAGNVAIALVRDPVDRFISACAKTGIAPADAITSPDFHFHTLSQLGLTDAVLPSVQLFKFETQIPEFCAAVGFASLPHENESENRPTLTSDEEAAVRAYYARDITIWEGIQ